VDWNGRTIDVHFETREDGALGDAIRPRTTLVDQAEWKHKVDEYAVTELLPVKNDSWREDGEAEFSRRNSRHSWSCNR